jgi:hypothetical protein
MYTSAVPQHCVTRSFNDIAPYQNVFHMHLEGFSLNYYFRHDPFISHWGICTENVAALTYFVKKLRTWRCGGNLEEENGKNQESRLSTRRKGREIWVKRTDRLSADSQVFGEERPVVWHRFLTYSHIARLIMHFSTTGSFRRYEMPYCASAWAVIKSYSSPNFCAVHNDQNGRSASSKSV